MFLGCTLVFLQPYSTNSKESGVDSCISAVPLRDHMQKTSLSDSRIRFRLVEMAVDFSGPRSKAGGVMGTAEYSFDHDVGESAARYYLWVLIIIDCFCKYS